MNESKKEKQKPLKPLLMGLLAAVILGGASFLAVERGWVLSAQTEQGSYPPHEKADSSEIKPSFVPLEPLLVSLARTEPALQLRFEATLEVASSSEKEIRTLMPRIMDVANTYLRATELSDLRDPVALVRIRSQILRRIQAITDSEDVHDLLVTKFLVN